MKKYFLISNKGSVSIEAAFMTFVFYPILYFMVVIFGTSFVYSGKVIDVTKGLADYISRWDNWIIDDTTSSNDNRLPYTLNRYFETIAIVEANNSISNNNPIYNYSTVYYNIYAAYISNGSYHVCASITKLNATVLTKSVLPVLDVQTLDLEGPVWIVQTKFKVRGIDQVHTTVRRPLGLTMTLSQNGTSYICSPNMPEISYSL